MKDDEAARPVGVNAPDLVLNPIGLRSGGLTMRTEVLDLFDGVRLRDDALQQVDENSTPFTERVANLVRTLPVGQEMTGEDVRLLCDTRGIRPHHHNAWGAAIMRCVRQGLLEKTGKYRKMVSASSHARETKVYRRAR